MERPIRLVIGHAEALALHRHFDSHPVPPELAELLDYLGQHLGYTGPLTKNIVARLTADANVEIRLNMV